MAICFGFRRHNKLARCGEEESAMDYVKENSKIWDQRSESNDIWSVPVTSDMVKEAREGNWQIVLTPTKPVPANWFPDDLCSKKILCLASGGGQQGPILAALGADVTVFDNSRKQLEYGEKYQRFTTAEDAKNFIRKVYT